MAMNPDEPLTLLGGLTARAFLRDYWQQKPLLVRQAIPGFESPLSPEELAGLACEEGVISRLVRERGETGSWALRTGPFDEDDFTTLPESHWTLLVSDMEKHLPELRAYLEPFRFIPDWRMDDLMVSYAAPEGSVGPHVDEYDVFLLQAQGRRRWQIARQAVSGDDFLPGVELRILRDFQPDQEWILEPGDMLYLPPRIPHHGVAVGPCMTWSVGFRAPAWRDLMAAWVDQRYEALAPQDRYADPGLEPQDNPGELSAAALARLIAGLRRAMAVDDAELARWLGTVLTEPKAELLEHMQLPETLTRDEALGLLQDGVSLERHGAARLAWMSDHGGLRLFVNGQEHLLPEAAGPLVRHLCAETAYDGKALWGLASGIDSAEDLLMSLCIAGILLEIPAP
ncbi:Cupin 4 family protein [Thioalkalivibrio sulfidiphilus HL-EbGr7]|uniref:Cupin 4 family protein n=2 Tax=Thioalkalivibrio TaxID=106633 RepID=B8GSM7_THISH|nr:Cupin 4 family protein [Thioalkalivibrio sulfidiphilus HL-EbGr7]